jgi:outer membrane protein assembly factor BamB
MCNAAALGLALAAALPLAAQVNVLTYQYNNARTGANLSETVLTPANVNAAQFGKLLSYPVDGYIYGQPLYLAAVDIPESGAHNVVYVATEHDSVYAFDADNYAPLWRVSFIDPTAGVTTVPWQDTNECNQIVPEIGITSTPVIDAAAGTIYVVAMTKESGAYLHRLHALDVATGSEQPGSPVVIQAAVAGTGDGGSTVVFQPAYYKQRPGLLLLNGIVYTAWSSHCDGGTYHGWLLGYDARTLQQVAVYNSTPDGSQGSFWAGGAAPAADADGNIYLVSANGTFDYAAGGRDLGGSYIKLATAGGLSVADSFTPFNVQQLNDDDNDVGSAGVVLLPDEAGSSAHPHLAIGAGKEGRIYLFDRDNMGQWQPGSDSQIVATTDANAIAGLFGNPAYFDGSVYFCGSGDPVLAFRIANAALSAEPAAQSPVSFDYPGCVPTISANGKVNAIVWALEPAGILRAYDAKNLARALYSDALGSYVKFTIPTVANGKVYAGTQDSLNIYGLLTTAQSTSTTTRPARPTAGGSPPTQ